MAVTPSVITPNNTPAARPSQSLMLTWTLLTATPDGRGVDVSGFDKINWQAVTGAAGGATLAFEGSNDGTNWYPLTKVGGTTAATLTASGGAEVNEHPMFVRPNLTTVGVGATWTVTLYASK